MAQTTTVVIARHCFHCDCAFNQEVTREDLKKIGNNEATTLCPNPFCGLPT